MKATVKFNLANVEYIFEIEEKNDEETLNRAITLANPPQRCNECDNKKYFKLDSNKTSEGYVYVNTICRNCGAKAKLGKYQNGGFFWHKFEKYVPKQEKQESQPAPQQNAPTEPTDDDLPF